MSGRGVETGHSYLERGEQQWFDRAVWRITLGTLIIIGVVAFVVGMCTPQVEPSQPFVPLTSTPTVGTPTVVTVVVTMTAVPTVTEEPEVVPDRHCRSKDGRRLRPRPVL